MSGTCFPERDWPTQLRVSVAGMTGLVVAVLTGAAAGWQYAAPAGWTVVAVVFTGSTWRVIGRMSPKDTASPATREDPARPLTDVITLTAWVASPAGVV